MLRACLAFVLIVAAAAPAMAATPRNPQIDYRGFQRLAREVEPYRRTRLVDWAAFSRMAARPGVLILDARSESAFAEGHIEGAVNLPLPDFNRRSLARLIGDRGRQILIYCNNNFENDEAPVFLKSLPLALNIGTFINLYGYGYRNVYELGDVIDFNNPAIPWVRARRVASAG